jgi:hypothetical protein
VADDLTNDPQYGGTPAEVYWRGVGDFFYDLYYRARYGVPSPAFDRAQLYNDTIPGVVQAAGADVTRAQEAVRKAVAENAASHNLNPPQDALVPSVENLPEWVGLVLVVFGIGALAMWALGRAGKAL